MSTDLGEQTSKASRWIEISPELEPVDDGARRSGGDLGVLCGILAFGFAMIIGFGATDQLYDLRVSLFAAAEIGLVSCALALSPRGSLVGMTFKLPAVLFFCWWMASYAWSAYQPGFVISNVSEVTQVLTVVLIGSLMPMHTLIRTIIGVGYIAIALIFIAWLVQPGLAFTGAGPTAAVPGLHGAFVHKNGMTSCLLVTLMAVLCFEQRRRVRTTVTVLVLVLIVLSQSSTGLIALLAAMSAYWMAKRYSRLESAEARGLGALIAFGSVLLVVGLGYFLSDLTSLVGKDTTFSGRDRVWDQALSMVAKRPFTGYGGSSWGLTIGIDPGKSINRGLGYVVRHSHNGAIELLVRLGVPGLLLYLSVFFGTIGAGFRVIRAHRALGLFVLSFCAIVFVFATSEVNTVFGVWFGLLCLLGSRAALARESGMAEYR
jgi:exopolysaccharide production protein ExoQ